PEDLVEQELAVMRLAVVDVEVERALAREQASHFPQARLEERQVVIETVAVGGVGEHARAVSVPLKADAPAILGADGCQRLARLALARVEGGIDVDELKGPGREARQQLEILAEEDLVACGSAPSDHRAERMPTARWSPALAASRRRESGRPARPVNCPRMRDRRARRAHASGYGPLSPGPLIAVAVALAAALAAYSALGYAEGVQSDKGVKPAHRAALAHRASSVPAPVAAFIDTG